MYWNWVMALVLGLSSCNRHYLTYDMVEAQLNVNHLQPDAPPVPIDYGRLRFSRLTTSPMD